jgi:hypothetical protein
VVANSFRDRSIYGISPPERACNQAHRTGRACIAQRRKAPIGNVIAGALGAAASVLIHLLFIGSVLWDGAPHRTKRSDVWDFGSAATTRIDEPVMTLILISDPRITKTSPDPAEIPSSGVSPNDSNVRVLSPDRNPVVDLTQVADSAIEQSPEAHDIAERALLFGRYMGQINARIERAWLRPRTEIGSALFECQVAITQDSAGNVTEVTLQDCNGDGRWQQSLVSAIQSASPLPRPPDPAVFSSTLTLRFESTAYSTDRRADGFEPASRVTSAGTSL